LSDEVRIRRIRKDYFKILSRGKAAGAAMGQASSFALK